MLPNARAGRVVWSLLVVLAAAMPAASQTSPTILPPIITDHQTSPHDGAAAVIADCNALLTFPVCQNSEEQELVTLINQARADSGRALLFYDYRLAVGARCHCADCATTPCFQHDDCDGTYWTERYVAQGYTGTLMEVMGAGYSNPASMFNAWFADSLRRSMILTAGLKHIGAGYVSQAGSPAVRYYTVAFGYANETAVGSPCTCCQNWVGNVDCDPADGVDIGDLTTLIDNLFISFTALCCTEEANCDGDAGNNVDIGDLTSLIDNLFVSFASLPACQ